MLQCMLGLEVLFIVGTTLKMMKNLGLKLFIATNFKHKERIKLQKEFEIELVIIHFIYQST